MYSIGGWTGRANIVWSANSISGNLDINSFPRNEYVLRSRILMTGKQERRIQLLMPFNFNSVYGVVYWHIIQNPQYKYIQYHRKFMSGYHTLYSMILRKMYASVGLFVSPPDRTKNHRDLHLVNTLPFFVFRKSHPQDHQP